MKDSIGNVIKLNDVVCFNVTAFQPFLIVKGKILKINESANFVLIEEDVTKNQYSRQSDQIIKPYESNPLQRGLDHAQNLGIPADEMLEILQDINRQLLDLDY